MIQSKRPVYFALCLLGALPLGCGSDSPGGQELIVAHVSPLQTLSIEGLAPAGTRAGFVRFEAEHFAYEVPVTTTQPLTVTAPIYVAEDGTTGSGLVHMYWLPTASSVSVSVINAQMPAPARRSDAVDLHIDLVVSDLPRFGYATQPGVLVRAFTAGNLAALSGSYDALFSSGVDMQLATDYQRQRMTSQTALTEALAAVDRVRDSATSEDLAPVIVPGGQVTASLSLDSLRLADRLVGAFLIAERLGVWTAGGKPVGARELNGSLGIVTAGLETDLEQEATNWIPSLTDAVATTVLERAGHLASFVSHATKVVAIAGALGIVSGTAVTAAAVTGAVAFCALTYAPAATATVIRAAGNMLRGNGSLTGYAYDSFAPGIQYVISQNLSNALGELEDRVAPWTNTPSKAVNALGAVVSSLSGWTDIAADSMSSWLVDCVRDPVACRDAESTASSSAVPNQPAPNEPGPTTMGTCNQAQVAGSDMPVTQMFEVGTACGELSLEYNTNSVEDAITVQYEGQTVAATGCVGAQGTLPIHICGTSSEVVVSVEPNCAGGTSTAWSFTLICPSTQ